MQSDNRILVHDLKPLAAKRGWSYHPRQPACAQFSLGSKTLADVAYHFLHNIPRLAVGPSKSRVNPDEPMDRCYANFLAVRPYDVPETFICTVPHALVAGHEGIVVTDAHEILAQSVLRKPGDPKTRIAIAMCKPSSAARVDLPGRYVSLLSYGSSNYAHWIAQTLPRLALIDPHSPKWADLRYILPFERKPFHRETLALLGIPEDRIVCADGRHNLAVEALTLCCAETVSFKPSAPNLLAARDRMLRAAGACPADRSPGRRIYISRARAARSVANEQELLPVLQRYGFEMVFMEDLTLVEQIRLAAQADVLCGPHGAGMLNLIFTRADCVCVELLNPFYMSASMLRLASIAGREHWHMFGENVDSDYRIYVDPKVLHRLLGTVLQCRNARDAQQAPTIAT